MALIEIGKIIRTHGFKGAFVVACPSGREASLEKIPFVLLGKGEADVRRFEISEAAWMPRGWKVKLIGIEEEAQAKALIGTLVYADRQDLPPPEPDQYYVTDLIGASVIDATAQTPIGTFEGVETGIAGQDRWWIKTSSDSFAVPAIKKFVYKVERNPATGKLIIWLQNYNEFK